MADAAIVGIGCRFPGGIDSADTFWDFLLRKGDGIIEVPSDRWSLDKFFDPDPDAPGRMYTRRGGFLTQSLWDFDADFFGISPREASIMDPQQRLMLEVTWEALDDAGMAGRVSGREVGVFVGGFMNDNTNRNVIRSAINSHSPTSASHTLLSARIAYQLDLRGPTMTIDTACSSSLVAMHQAVVAMERGECETAIVGGTNTMLQPETFISMCKGRFLSFDGRCKSFDASADGYGRGEGAGAVILKPLDVALRHRDRIYAVVRGSGVNQDGKTLAIPVPSAAAQQALAFRVREQAGIDPHRVAYVEAHGTGTPVGDPIEMTALGAVYGADAGRTTPLAVGSVKNNIGHTEAAAGVAGIIKAALTLHHRTIAPQAWLQTPNPDIRWDELGLRVPLESEPVRSTGGLPVVAVNSFGYGGTNAHVLLEQAPVEQHVRERRRSPLPILPLSARNDVALRTLAAEVSRAYPATGGPAMAAATTEALWTRRAHHPLRTAFVYHDIDDLRSQLEDFALGRASRSPSRAIVDGSTDPVFVYSGMGPQWWAMGRSLLTGKGRCAEVAREVDDQFRAVAGWSILAEMLRDEADSRISRTEFAQPANFVLQVALTAQLAEWGIHPNVVVGHSVGEVSAAYVSGALSLRDAVMVSYHRSHLQATTAGAGGMLAVGLAEAQARQQLAAFQGISIAAINSPSAVTLAGDVATLERLGEQLTEAEVFAKALRVEVPYHSHLMDPILDDLRTALADITPSDPTIPMVSTVTGSWVEPGESVDASYWCRNVREPVRFADATNTLLADGHRVFLELGPHPVLGGNIRELLVQQGISGTSINTLSRDTSDGENLRRVIVDLYCAGSLDSRRTPGPIDPGVEHLELPPYPWQRRLLWTQEPATVLDRLGAPDSYAMLGDPTASPTPEWEVQLAQSNLPWLRDHVVDGAVVLPGAAYLDAALSAAAHRTGRTSFALESVEFLMPLVVDDHDVPVVRVSVEETTHRFTIQSRPAVGRSWVVNARGRLIEADVDARHIDVVPEPDAIEVTGADLYAGLAAHGLAYGTTFRLVHTAQVGENSVLAQLDLAPLSQLETSSGLQHLVHPAIVDAALQCFAALTARAQTEEQSATVVVPASVARVRWTGPIPDNPVVLATRSTENPLAADICIASATGEVALSMWGVEFRPVAPPPDIIAQLDHLFYEPIWEVLESAGTSEDLGRQPEVESLVVVCLSESVSPRGAQIAAARPESEILVMTGQATTAEEDRLLELLRAASTRPSCERIRLVVVAGPDFDGATHVYALAQVARAVGRLLAVGDEADLAGLGHQDGEMIPAVRDVRGVVVTEQAFCLPIDASSQLTHAALTGARRSLLNEQFAARWRLVDAEPDTPEADVVDEVFADLVDPTAADEVALRAGARWAVRLRQSLRTRLGQWDVPEPLADPDRSFEVTIPRSRLLGDLALRALDRPAPGSGEVEVRMDAIGLGYKDALKVLGILGEKELHGTYFGTELAIDGYGVVERVGPGINDLVPGDRMHVCVPGPIRRHVVAKPEGGTTRVGGPDEPEMDPFLFSSVMPIFTAEWGFGELARLQPGETVLIHGAAGGMGVAAIQVALRLGARVIATAGSDDRRAFVRGLGAHEVLNSRSISFVDDILRLTEGRGVDVIYSSAPGEILQQNLRVAAEFGRILDIGKADIYTSGVLDLRPFDRNLSFFAIDMDRALTVRPELIRDGSQQVWEGMREDAYSVVPYTAFGLDQLTDAFETVARSKQIGRVVLDLRTKHPMVHPKPPVFELNPHGTYLITGGFGAFGLAIARWLVRAGAQHVVLVGRSGASTEAARAQLAAFADDGVKIREELLDIADYDEVVGLIERIQRDDEPLRGIFHAAGVVNNLDISQMTLDSVREIFDPKVRGALHLDRATAAADIELDHFVLFSSASAIIGTMPQIAYAAANSVLDALAWSRHAQGKPTLAVNWGLMSGGGMADSETVARLGLMSGNRPVDMDFATDLLARCLPLDLPQIGICDVDWAQWASTYTASQRTPRFAQLVLEAGGGASGAGALRADIMALPPDQRNEVVTYLLAEQLAVVLGVAAETVDLDTPVADLGLDSLMGIEFGARVMKYLDVKMSVFAVAGLTLAALGAKIATQIAHESVAMPEVEPLIPQVL